MLYSFYAGLVYGAQWAKTYGGLETDVATSIQQTSDGGYIVKGYTYSSGTMFPDGLILKLDNRGNVKWQKTYGSVSNYEKFYFIQQTSDGGYIVGGEAWILGETEGEFLAFILKLNAQGNIEWQKTYGGTGYYYVNLIQQTSDGGYIVKGYTLSFGAYTSSSYKEDIWILKLNTYGNIPKCNLFEPSYIESYTYNVNIETESVNVSNSTYSVKPFNGTTTDINLIPSEKCYYTPSGEQIILIFPNGGQEIPAGGNCTIKWQSVDTAHHFTLQLSTDNRQTWSLIKRNVTGNSYNWTIPVPDNNKRQSFIKVIAFDSSNNRIGADRSDKPCTIEVVKVTAPNGGETFISGVTYNITWRTNATIRPVAKVQLFYTVDGGARWKLIEAFNENPGIFTWTLPIVDSTKTQCKVKVVLKDSDGKIIGSDISDGFFTIIPHP